MPVAGYVTLGNISCNLCRNKIARQAAREIAQCNSALIKLLVNPGSLSCTPKIHDSCCRSSFKVK